MFTEVLLTGGRPTGLEITRHTLTLIVQPPEGDYDQPMSWLWRVPLFILISAWALYLYSTPSAKVSEHVSRLQAWWKSRRG